MSPEASKVRTAGLCPSLPLLPKLYRTVSCWPAAFLAVPEKVRATIANAVKLVRVSLLRIAYLSSARGTILHRGRAHPAVFEHSTQCGGRQDERFCKLAMAVSDPRNVERLFHNLRVPILQ
jgi:hypothetical protein